MFDVRHALAIRIAASPRVDTAALITLKRVLRICVRVRVCGGLYRMPRLLVREKLMQHVRSGSGPCDTSTAAPHPALKASSNSVRFFRLQGSSKPDPRVRGNRGARRPARGRDRAGWRALSTTNATSAGTARREARVMSDTIKPPIWHEKGSRCGQS